MHHIAPLEQLDVARFETPAILKKLAISSRRLAELKGIAGSIPNQGILINTLGLQEAKDSSEIENIITTHDELFKDDVLPEAFANPAAKEVLRYRLALLEHISWSLILYAILPRKRIDKGAFTGSNTEECLWRPVRRCLMV
jgi:Fic family protein